MQDGHHPDSGLGHSSHSIDHSSHSGHAVSAALHASGHSHADHYGTGAVVFSSIGLVGSGHVINTVSNAGAHYGNAGHIDGPGANQMNPNQLKLQDIKGAKLLIAHATGLVDRGCGSYSEILDAVAAKVGLKRIDPRPDKKGENNPGLDGILPWNAWGDPNSKVRPDGWMPLVRGLTDRHIHVFAIPVRGRDQNGARAWVVPNRQRVTLTVRITAWRYAGPRDVEVKIEAFINSTYVSDPFQGGYTFFGRKTEEIEVKSLELMKELFALITAKGEKADQTRRKQHLASIANLPHLKGRNAYPKREIGVSEGTAADQAELDAEEVATNKATDRRIEDTVASGASGTTPAPAPAAGGFDDDDGSEGLVAAIASPAAVVASPTPAVVPPSPTPAPAPAPVPTPVPTRGTFVIPKNLKK